MKRMLAATVTILLLLIVGPAASQDAAPSKDTEPAKDAEPAKEAESAQESAPAKEAEVETEPPELKRLAGSYTLIGNQADSAKKIATAIEPAIMGMGGLKKSVARKRLESVNQVVTRLKISSVRKEVTVGMDDYVVTAPLDGGTAEVKTPSGDIAHASFKLETASLIQDMVQSEGRRENTFRFNSKGELVMHVRETSPKLTSAVSYSLVYKRAGR